MHITRKKTQKPKGCHFFQPTRYTDLNCFIPRCGAAADPFCFLARPALHIICSVSQPPCGEQKKCKLGASRLFPLFASLYFPSLSSPPSSSYIRLMTVGIRNFYQRNHVICQKHANIYEKRPLCVRKVNTTNNMYSKCKLMFTTD